MTLMTVINPLTAEQSKKTALEALWQEYEKKQLRNKRHQTKLDGFYDEFAAQFLEKEQASCHAIAQLVRLLLTFVPRKSIKDQPREMLLNWIEEEISVIESNPFNPIDTDKLRHELTVQIAAYKKSVPALALSTQELDTFRLDMESMFGLTLDLDDAALRDFIYDPVRFQEYFEEKISEKMEAGEGAEHFFDFDEAEFEDDSQADDEDFFADLPESDQMQHLELFSNKSITKLYRQLANQFHPDKEPDPAQKTLKKELMQRLSKAKKNKDTIALLMLALEHLPKYKLEADDKMIKGLEAALQVKIELLNQDYYAMNHCYDIKSTVWYRFGRGSKASRAKGLVEYAQQIALDTQNLLDKCKKIKTVKDLQQELSLRKQENKFGDVFDFSMFNNINFDGRR